MTNRRSGFRMKIRKAPEKRPNMSKRIRSEGFLYGVSTWMISRDGSAI